MFSRLVKQFSEKEGVTETLKAENQMLWVQKINNLRNAAMEIVSMNLFIANTAQVRSPSTDGGFSHFGCNLKVIFGENSNNSIRTTGLDLSDPIHFFGSGTIFCNICNSR